MLKIPEEIKELFKSDNDTQKTQKKFKLIFYNDKIESLYPHDTLFPDNSLFPSDHGAPWLVIENNRIESESLIITESLSESEDMEFGSCEATMLEIVVADVVEDVTAREFVFTVEIGGYEMAMGIYTVESFVRQADRRKRKITAYDRMRWFNMDASRWYNDLRFPMTLKAFRDSLCQYIGIQQAGESLLFDFLEITKTIEPSEISALDILKAICEINGCFGHVDKTGQLIYIHLQSTGLYPANDLFPYNDLYPAALGGDGSPVELIDKYKQGMTYEDYLVEGIDSLVIREQEGDIGANVGNGTNVYTIEGNFLVYGKNSIELLNIAQSLLPQISGRIYRPSKIQCVGRPWVEVGDAIRAYTRDDIVETFVMKRISTGCQAMTDSYEATGSQHREEVFGINKQIIQLEGKSAVIVKNVEEVSVKLTDLKEQEESHFAITSSKIEAEVKERKDGDTELTGKITVEAGRITQEITDRKNGEVALQSSITQTATQIRSEVKNTTDGLSSSITQQAGRITQEITDRKNGDNSLTTKITQTAKDITLEVSQKYVANGTISSKLSLEQGKITITSNRLIVDSTNFKLDGEGNATFTGKIAGGSINIGNGKFTVDSNGKVVARDITVGTSSNKSAGYFSILIADSHTCNNLTVQETAEIDDLHAGYIECNSSIICSRIYSTDAGEWWSDERLKRCIENLSEEECFKVISELRPVSFVMNNSGSPGLGFVAQEVIKICDKYNINLPLYGTHNGYYTIPYMNFLPIVIKVLQKIMNKINW